MSHDNGAADPFAVAGLIYLTVILGNQGGQRILPSVVESSY